MSSEFPKSATIEAEMKNTRKNTVYFNLYVCIYKHIKISITYFNTEFLKSNNLFLIENVKRESKYRYRPSRITVPPKYLIYQYLI